MAPARPALFLMPFPPSPRTQEEEETVLKVMSRLPGLDSVIGKGRVRWMSLRLVPASKRPNDRGLVEELMRVIEGTDDFGKAVEGERGGTGGGVGAGSTVWGCETPLPRPSAKHFRI